MKERIRFVIIGTGKRSVYSNAPLLNVLKEDVEVVGVWGRLEDKARELSEKFRVPWFTDLEQMQNDLQGDAAVVSVANPANGEIGRRVIELGLYALLETQIAWRNPFRAHYMDDEMIAVADCLMSLVHAIRENKPPEYGSQQAQLDEGLTLAMHESVNRDGAGIPLPLSQVS